MPYVVVAYDISDDLRRLRAARRLRDYLERVQRSVYEGELDAGALARLRERVLPLLDPREDGLRIYTLCAACRERVEVHGVGQGLVEDPDVWIV